MFAVFTLEREPMQWAQLPAALKDWVQGAGGVAAAALLICWIAYKASPARRHVWRGVFPMLRAEGWSAAGAFFAFFLVFTVVGYGLAGLVLVASQLDVPLGAWADGAIELGLMVGGGCALIAVLVPVLLEFGRFRPRRIWALARLSLKEAFRKRVVWGFSAMALIFLFADWFVPYKPEDQLRNYVRVIYWSLTPLFLLVACWLGAFGIPTEVKNQSIHTIVTKPVERFEIVLGRFLGYGLLLSAVLFGLTGISLLYVWRGVSEEAKKESYMARVPIYADLLSFHGTKDAHIGENVGRVWDYRSYIGGPYPGMLQRQYAIWSFDRLPTDSADFSKPIDFEFTFDIFRMTKGKEDRGVNANFTFADGSLSVEQIEKHLDDLQQEKSRLQQQRQAEAKSNQAGQEGVTGELAAKYGVLRLSREVIDYHTQALGGDDPQERRRVGLELAQLFRGISQRHADQPGDKREGAPANPALKVLVSVDHLQRESAAQKLGVAKPDLYVIAGMGPFWANFIKGIIGMWFTVMLVLALAIACSTYFSGIISLLLTAFLLLFGYCKESFVEFVQGKGGGPFENAWRLFTKSASAIRLDDSAASNLLRGGDEAYRFFVRLILNVFPDVNRYDLHPYVANGFDISWSRVLFLDNFLPLVGYVLPCAILAFYLMKFREVANPT